MADKKMITEDMPVIQDVMDFEYELTEDKDEQDQKAYRLKGVFQQSDVKNGNGRVYPRIVLEREVTRLQEGLDQKRILGELDHPADAKIHLEKVSHLVTRLDMKTNGEVYGEATVLETPAGKVLQELLKSGVKLGISSRGFGTVKKNNGVDEVAEDYKMVTFDIVSDPSIAGAFPHAVYENNEEAVETVEEDKVSLSLVLEDVLDDMQEDVKVELNQEYIGVADGVRFYLVEGGYDSYGTFLKNVSHHWHLEVKDGQDKIKVGINEAKLNKIGEEYGNKIVQEILNKIGYKGYNPETLSKDETRFAADDLKVKEV